MSEIELKFQIPASKQKALRLAFQRLKPEIIQLHAKYFDTAEHYLQQHKIALRWRLENDLWIQTLKAPKNNIERLEIETELGSQEPASIDLQPYLQDQKLRKILSPLIKHSKNALHIQFETQIQRQRFVQKHADSDIELALDRGRIIADQHSIAVNEIEFELKQGHIHDLIQTILPWIEKYQIWLDSSSKALKGQILQQALTTAPAQYQTELKLRTNESATHALPKIVSNCLEHLLPNSSAIAHQHYQAVHVHQARVAIRRLRSAFKTFGSSMNQDTSAWQLQLAELFRHLGTTRDRDALAESLIPQLTQAGAPILEIPVQNTADDKDISALFRTPETTRLLLELIAFSHTAPVGKKNLKKHVRKKFNQMHSNICRAAGQFEQMTTEEKHRVRKQVKRLRYSVEFIASLYPQTAVKQYLKVLKPLQENLGHFNDLCVAHTLFEQELKQQPEAWFVLGWIASEQRHIEQQIQQELLVFSQAQRFWSFGSSD